jgi:hypothetical protein
VCDGESNSGCWRGRRSLERASGGEVLSGGEEVGGGTNEWFAILWAGEGQWGSGKLAVGSAGPGVDGRWPATVEHAEEDDGVEGLLIQSHWSRTRARRRCSSKRGRRRSGWPASTVMERRERWWQR